MFKGFTRCSRRIINQIALAEARRYNHSVIYPEHVLIGLLKDGSGIAYKIAELVSDPVQFQFVLEDFIAQFEETNDENLQEYKDISKFYNLDVQVPLSGRMHKCLYQAIDKARELEIDELDSFVLFVACCQEKNSKAESLIKGLNISFHNLQSYYHRFFDHIANYENMEPEDKDDESYLETYHSNKNQLDTSETSEFWNDVEKKNKSKKSSINFFDDVHEDESPIEKDKKERIIQIKKNFKKRDTNKSTKKHSRAETETKDATENYVIDLTETMFRKKNTLYGRNTEIEQIFRTLLRKQKNNPLLVGDPGVGKTALIEEIARRICWGEAPLPLLNARILQLDLAAMTAGTRFRGDFEERLCNLLEKIEHKSKTHPIILFIDEFHHLMGAGLSAGTSMDAAGILKPALARGKLSCIGATTAEEYQKHIETDKAFARRVNPVYIEELSPSATFHALNMVRPEFEKKHQVYFDEESLHEIVRLTKDYMFDRKLPDKAIDMLDEIGTFYKLKKSKSTPELVSLYHNMHTVLESAENKIERMKKNTTSTDHNSTTTDAYQSQYVQISQENEKIHDIIVRRSALQKALHTLSSSEQVTITGEHVRTVMSHVTGIPAERMDDKKHVMVQNLNTQLYKNVIGQDNACDALIAAVQRSLVGLKEEKRPVGSFLFLGPTGVGKTHTALQLAQNLFGTESALTRFDMSDFSEQHSISRLIGAPPGYVGFEDSGLLVKSVRRRPRQVLLFDEIEKANSKVFDIFLQILEDGVLQGQRGEEADFRHCIIIMTSNIGSSEIYKTSGVGFTNSAEEHDNQERDFKNIVNEELIKTFRPEFINRFDEMILFKQLNVKSISKIIDRLSDELNILVQKHNITLSLSASAKKLLCDKNFNPQYGARSIRRGMREIENLIADALITEKISEGDVISIVSQVDKNTKQAVYSIRKKQPSRTQIKKEILSHIDVPEISAVV